MSSELQIGQERPQALRDLPPFPGVALQLLTLIDRDDVEIGDIEQVLRMDPALSAKILQVTNSAFYGFRRPIDSLKQAAVMLGTTALKRTALTMALSGILSGRGRNEALQRCWHHSVAAALIAEELAKMLGEPSDRAYTAGLLHDIGRLALLAAYPDRWQGMLEVARRQGIEELAAERELFDIDHCAAGRWLAREWALPDELINAIANHHGDLICDSSLISIITAANVLADLLGYDVFEMERDQTIADVTAGLPLQDQDHAAERIQQVKEKLDPLLASY
jgi:putative nucleotidyltransferase with HDIG domain